MLGKCLAAFHLTQDLPGSLPIIYQDDHFQVQTRVQNSDLFTDDVRRNLAHSVGSLVQIHSR